MFSFGCGLNQLYWYYAHMKEQECDKQAASDKEECYLKIKYFSKYVKNFHRSFLTVFMKIFSLFETLQTLYWGVFGLVEKDRLELHRRHAFTMFTGLTMFGSYCTIMIIILINMLIAMMNNSYQRIAVNILIKLSSL
jgi:transient receptor potential cation channel subfamily C protein 4